MSFTQLPRRRNAQITFGWIAAAVVLLLVFGRSLCSWVIDYFWWGEMGQVPTWLRMTAYRYLPGLAAWVILFVALWIAHARGMKHARESLRDHPAYARISTLVLAFVALMVTLSTVDGWTVARFVGGQAAQVASTSWSDPVFGRPLEFYFFALPFYDMLLTWVAAAAFCGALAYYLAARGWQLRRDMPGFALGQDIDLRDLRTLGRLETGASGCPCRRSRRAPRCWPRCWCWREDARSPLRARWCWCSIGCSLRW